MLKTIKKNLVFNLPVGILDIDCRLSKRMIKNVLINLTVFKYILKYNGLGYFDSGLQKH